MTRVATPTPRARRGACALWVVLALPACDRAAPPIHATPAAERSGGERARAAAGRVRRDGLTLRLATDAGDVALVDDTSDTEAYQRHGYLGLVRGAPFHLVRLSRHEGRAWLLVHTRTGRRIEVDAPPVASPDGARLVTASMDLVAAFDPNRLAVWRLEGDGAVREWTAEPTTWGPLAARWVTPDSVAFTAHHVGPDTPEPVRRTEGALVRRGDWRLLAP